MKFPQVYTTAALYETSRLFTIVSRLGRVALKDTTTTAKRFKTASDGAICDIEDFPVVIKKGSNIIIDVSAVHMNRAFYFYTLSKRYPILSLFPSHALG